MTNVAVEEPLEVAAVAAEDLYHLRDTYFPLNPDDKISKLQQQSDLALKLLDSIPPGIFLFPIPDSSHVRYSDNLVSCFGQ